MGVGRSARSLALLVHKADRGGLWPAKPTPLRSGARARRGKQRGVPPPPDSLVPTCSLVLARVPHSTPPPAPTSCPSSLPHLPQVCYELVATFPRPLEDSPSSVHCWAPERKVDARSRLNAVSNMFASSAQMRHNPNHAALPQGSPLLAVADDGGSLHIYSIEPRAAIEGSLAGKESTRVGAPQVCVADAIWKLMLFGVTGKHHHQLPRHWKDPMLCLLNLFSSTAAVVHGSGLDVQVAQRLGHKRFFLLDPSSLRE